APHSERVRVWGGCPATPPAPPPRCGPMLRHTSDPKGFGFISLLALTLFPSCQVTPHLAPYMASNWGDSGHAAVECQQSGSTALAERAACAAYRPRMFWLRTP